MIALLLPSYKRQEELAVVLEKTPLTPQVRFICVVNCEPDFFQWLRKTFSDRAIFIDERSYGRLGGCKAYNLAFQTARDQGFDSVILFSDDILPRDANWLERVDQYFFAPGHRFGIFSSDECHHGHFGWNVMKSCPIAHFFIGKTELLGNSPNMFDPRYKQYVIDLDIATRVLKRGEQIALLPVQMRHYRSQKERITTGGNYDHDRALFCALNPEFSPDIFNAEYAAGTPEGVAFIPDAGHPLLLPDPGIASLLRPWPKWSVEINSELNQNFTQRA